MAAENRDGTTRSSAGCLVRGGRRSSGHQATAGAASSFACVFFAMLLGRPPSTALVPLVEKETNAELRIAALRALAAQQDKEVPTLLIKLWPGASPRCAAKSSKRCCGNLRASGAARRDRIETHEGRASSIRCAPGSSPITRTPPFATGPRSCSRAICRPIGRRSLAEYQPPSSSRATRSWAARFPEELRDLPPRRGHRRRRRPGHRRHAHQERVGPARSTSSRRTPPSTPTTSTTSSRRKTAGSLTG